MIPGLTIIDDFINQEKADQLIALIKGELDSLPTSTDGSTGRTRILRYGFDYNPPNEWLRNIPPLLDLVKSNSVTLNEYPPKHGIAPHFDSNAFPGPISVLSLNATALIAFHKGNLVQRFPLYPNSLLTMDGDARNKWKHEVPRIPPGKTRYSVVFRNFQK